jgi:hypothetical protein
MRGSFYRGRGKDVDAPHDTEIKTWIAKARITRVTRTIETELEGIGWEDFDWIHLIQDWLCQHGNGPSGSIKGGEFLD